VASVAVVAALLAIPCASFAAPADSAPPGNSAVNQYTETFPSAAGPKISNAVWDRQPRSPRETLGSESARRLRERGAQGQAVATLAAATAPPRSSPTRTGAAPADGGSPATAIAGQALGTSSSSRLGWVLPLIILATVAWSASYLWRRRPRSP
jgi:hypothetical protein